MEDIARKLDINVATVSRVANDKYVQTPQGVREIKYFFNSGVARAGGDTLTKTSVKQRITSIIESEDPAKPFSDQEIYRRLQAEGIKLARRTVTKYREELHIPAARFRKRVFDKNAKATSADPDSEPRKDGAAEDDDSPDARSGRTFSPPAPPESRWAATTT
jgi:hypothetical protein